MCKMVNQNKLPMSIMQTQEETKKPVKCLLDLVVISFKILCTFMLQIYKLSGKHLLVAAFFACVEFRQNAQKRGYSCFSTNLEPEYKCNLV